MLFVLRKLDEADIRSPKVHKPISGKSLFPQKREGKKGNKWIFSKDARAARLRICLFREGTKIYKRKNWGGRGFGGGLLIFRAKEESFSVAG